MYKLYVRLHLDYGDTVYRRYDPDFSKALTNCLEHVRYAASFAVIEAWVGTNSQKLYDELGSKCLYERRLYRTLRYSFKIKLTQSI